MNVSNYLVNALLKLNIDTVFCVTGGGSMHLVNAFGCNKRFKKIYLHQEQSCSMAADIYARINKKPAVVCVTTGPGGINALNGVFGAYTDSVPMIILSGQVKTSTSMNHKKLKKIRQLGDQENDIIYMTKKITKESFFLNSKLKIKKNFIRKVKLSFKGRPGPVWFDVPIDIQGQKW